MRVAIVDQVDGVGGLDRFLQGLACGLLQARETKDWEFNLVLRRSSEWAVRLRDPRLRVEIMPSQRSLAHLDRGIRLVRRAVWRMRGRPGRPPDAAALARRRWIEEWARGQHLNLVYFTSPFMMPCPRLSVPLLTTFHDFNHKRFTSWPPHLREQIDRDIIQWLASSSIAIVSSSFIAGELAGFHPDFADRVKIIRLGIPSAPRHPLPGEWPRFQARHNLPNRFLLTVGFLLPHKNQKVILEALAILRRDGLEVPLVFVGPSTQLLGSDPGSPGRTHGDQILAAAGQLGLRHGVDFFGLGQVEEVELEMLYQRADALVMSTLYEAQSLPVREAMRAGCPVVCSNIPPLVEDMKVSGGLALIFDPHDASDLARALRSVLADPIAARRRAAPFRHQVEAAFDWRKTASGYLAAFEEAIKSHPQRPIMAG
jgi:glycosyltransferase involved in cell wall biosynthesis